MKIKHKINKNHVATAVELKLRKISIGRSREDFTLDYRVR